MRLNLDIESYLRVCQKDASLEEVWDKQFQIDKVSNSVKTSKYMTDVFFNKIANGSEVLDPSILGSGFTDVLIGIGDGATTTFNKTLTAFAPIDIDSVVLNWTESGAKTASADSVGSLTGSGLTSGTISQDGTLALEFATAPEDGTAITLDFDRGTTVVTSIYFDLATDASVVTTDMTDFTTKLGLEYSAVNLDWMEDNNYNIYICEMSTTYSGAETDPITGVGIYAKTFDVSNATLMDRLLLKSRYPSVSNDLFPSGLILNSGSTGQCAITLTMNIKIAK